MRRPVATAPLLIVALGLTASGLVTKAGAQTLASGGIGYRGGPSSAYTPPAYTPTPHSAPVDHVSTTIEAHGRSLAAVLKAYADGRLSLAQARILAAEAQAREYNNRVVNTETFLARKQLLENDRESERRAKRLRRQAGAERAKLRRRTAIFSAYRLSASRLDRSTGRIVWPRELATADFEGFIGDLEGLFAGIADEGPQYDRFYREPIVETCEAFRQALRERRFELSWKQYEAAQKFLLGLRYEAEYWGEGRGAGVQLASLAAK